MSDLPKKQPGFTLLELLVSMTLFAAIAGLLMTSFFNFQGIGQKVEDKLKMRQELRNLETLVREDLANVVYLEHYSVGTAESPRPSGIRGTDAQESGLNQDRLDLQVHSRGRFFTSFKRSVNPELFEVSYYFDRDDQGVIGFYRREAYFIDGPIESGGEGITHRLSTHLTEMNLTYYDQAGATTPAWVSRKKAALPTGIDVQLTLKGESGESFSQSFTVNVHPSMGPGVVWGRP